MRFTSPVGPLVSEPVPDGVGLLLSSGFPESGGVRHGCLVDPLASGSVPDRESLVFLGDSGIIGVVSVWLAGNLELVWMSAVGASLSPC